jgi:hypothetical protein
MSSSHSKKRARPTAASIFNRSVGDSRRKVDGGMGSGGALMTEDKANDFKSRHLEGLIDRVNIIDQTQEASGFLTPGGQTKHERDVPPADRAKHIALDEEQRALITQYRDIETNDPAVHEMYLDRMNDLFGDY